MGSMGAMGAMGATGTMEAIVNIGVIEAMGAEGAKGDMGVEQWQVCLYIYIAIWLEHLGDRLYGFMGLRSKMSDWMD